MVFASACVVPVNRLPPESLAHIFGFLAYEIPPDEDSRVEFEKWDWIVVTHVCQYWRTVTTENPSLWTNLCIFPRVGRTKKFLELSKQMDLQVHFTLSSESSNNYDEAFNHLSLILQNIHRLNLLHLCLDSPSGLWTRIQESLAQPAPRLKSLELFVFQDLRDRPEAISLPSLPKLVTSLEKVSLGYFNISPCQSFLKCLRILSLDWVEDLTSSDLLGIFGACPQLEEFALINSDVEVTSWSSTVSLPKLRKIKIDELDFETYSKLLSCLSIPASLNWDIDCTVSSYGDAVNKGIFPSLLKNPLSVEDIVIDAFSHELRVHATGTYKLGEIDSEAIIKTKLHLRQYIDMPVHLDAYQIYTQLAPVIRNACWGSAKSVHICVNSGIFTKNAWINLLNAFPFVQHLDVCFARNCTTLRSVEGLVEALAMGDAEFQKDFATCPKLNQLSLRYINLYEIGDVFVPMIKNCLQIRKMQGSGLHQLLISSMYSVGDERSLAILSKLVDVISWKEEETSLKFSPYYDDDQDEFLL